MLNPTQAKDIVARWLQAASSHDVDQIVSFYAADAELESPVVIQLLNEPSGRIKGQAALHDYFSKGLAAYPHMSMHLIDAAVGIGSVTVWYANHKGTRTSAYLEIDAAGKIRRNVTHYST